MSGRHPKKPGVMNVAWLQQRYGITQKQFVQNFAPYVNFGR
jgi:hypothetical protein